MSFFLPAGWTMSAKGHTLFSQHQELIESIIRRRVRKYNLPSMDRNDLLQEARLAAAYAVDTFDPAKGAAIAGYISAVVWRALTMVAGLSLAQRRQPFQASQDGDGNWVKTPASLADIDDHVVGDDTKAPDRELLKVGERYERALRRRERLSRLGRINLSDDGREILRVRLSPPPELQVAVRNAGHTRLDLSSVADYLGWTKKRARAALQEAKAGLVGVGLKAAL